MQGTETSEQGTGERAKALRVAVVGAGAFGRNHLRVYRELEQAGFPVELAAVVDPNEGARAAAVAKYGVRGCATIEECLAAD
ncbi:MAG: Gfo/Idh/MocA family oxidoreductase, partial [Solirubrobacteraceae bacterium]